MKKLTIILLFICSLLQGQVPFMMMKNNIVDTNTTVVIGTQEWMQYNLAVTNYNDGTPIPKLEGTFQYTSTPSYCWYNDDSITYSSTYGALYNWYAVNTGKLCPIGWHTPTYNEWNILIEYLGGRDGSGGKLKEAGYDHWALPNRGATNEVNFTSLPGGYKYNISNDLTLFAHFWTSTDLYEFTTYSSIMSNISDSTWFVVYDKTYGFSMRCIKD